LLVDLQSSTSDGDANGAEVTDFICTHLTSLARSKTRAFVIFFLLGCGFKISTGAALLTFLFCFAGCWTWRAFGGLLAHGMRRDENVHLR
jgi:hypothetical protein